MEFKKTISLIVETVFLNVFLQKKELQLSNSFVLFEQIASPLSANRNDVFY